MTPPAPELCNTAALAALPSPGGIAVGQLHRWEMINLKRTTLPTAIITEQLQRCSHKILCVKTNNGAFTSQHFKQHIQAVGNEKDIQSPSDAKRYFCFFNTPGSVTFRKLVDELQKPIDKGKYKFEDRDPTTGERSYCGVPIPADAPPRPNDQAVWCNGKWMF